MKGTYPILIIRDLFLPECIYFQYLPANKKLRKVIGITVQLTGAVTINCAVRLMHNKLHLTSL